MIEDAFVVYKGVAVITNFKKETRKEEIRGLRNFLELFGLQVNEIKAPGTLDGGDVLKVGDEIFVGLSERTNKEGIRQLTEFFGV